MDPHANVVEATSLAREIVKMEGALEIRESGKPTRAVWHYAERLAELVIALDEWRTNGGFDPYANPDAPVVNPQANALLERCRRNRISSVAMDPDGGSPGQGLPNGYIFVVEQGRERGFEVGIAPDGRVSS